MTDLNPAPGHRDLHRRRRRGPQWLAARTATAGLAAAGAVHLAWALGVAWPAADAAELARWVVGTEPFPSPGATLTVAAGLGAAATVVHARSAEIRDEVRPGSCLWSVGSALVATALLARGAAGLVISTFDLMDADPTFTTWDRRLYSPLCLVLGALTIAGTTRRPAPRPAILGTKSAV